MENETLMLEVYKDIAQPIARQIGITLGEVGNSYFRQSIITQSILTIG